MTTRPNRRSSGRYNLGFPMEISTEIAGAQKAICLNISTTGLMLACKTKPSVGATVELDFRVMPEHANSIRVSACVVRVTEKESDPAQVWPVLVAVQFDDPYPHIEPLLKIASQQFRIIDESLLEDTP